MGETKERISMSDVWSMFSAALFFDATNALLALMDGGTFTGPLVNTVAWMTFFFWFGFKGVKIWKIRKGPAWLAVGVIWGFIPLLNMLPELAAVFTRMALAVRIEDGGSVGGVLGFANRLANAEGMLNRIRGINDTNQRTARAQALATAEKALGNDPRRKARQIQAERERDARWAERYSAYGFRHRFGDLPPANDNEPLPVGGEIRTAA